MSSKNFHPDPSPQHSPYSKFSNHSPPNHDASVGMSKCAGLIRFNKMEEARNAVAALNGGQAIAWAFIVNTTSPKWFHFQVAIWCSIVIIYLFVLRQLTNSHLAHCCLLLNICRGDVHCIFSLIFAHFFHLSKNAHFSRICCVFFLDFFLIFSHFFCSFF